MSSMRPLDRSPQLAARLGALRRALLAAAWLRGLSLLLVGAALWAGWAFLADWGLRVPAWVRWLHLVLFVAGLGWAAWRWLIVPLRRQPRARELALLLERAHGGRGELLLSAVELQQSDSAAAPELAPRILRAADAEAAR
ncbi:MAG: DUF4175 domain-containing protein, partial [Planctomycetes bacterium]|nr:DUF4175 domain-containing protein [Planctomycetota bacterium]